MNILHASDLHLDSPMDGLPRDDVRSERIKGATRRALENLVQLALTERVDLVLLAGDLFDGDWPDYHTGVFFAGQMARIRDAGIPIVALQGNHDAQSKMSKTLAFDRAGVRMLSTARAETVQFEALGVAVHGQGFSRPDVTEDLAAAYPDPVPGMFNVGLLHTALEGRPGHGKYAPTTEARLVARGYDYWALGHVHQHAVVRRDPWVVFSGNLQGRHVRETGAKGAVLVRVHEGRVTALEHRALDVVRWHVCSIDMTGATQAADAFGRVDKALRAAHFASAGRLAAVRVEFTGPTDLHLGWAADLDALRGQVQAMAEPGDADGVWIETVKLCTRRSGQQRSAERTAGTDGDVVQCIDAAVAALEADGADLAAAMAVIEDLAGRLPPGVRTGIEGLDLRDAATVRGLLRAAGDLAMGSLLAGARQP
ncbi:MAG: DNA repair exonuclease [Myxococcales bacterium]|nr:DNA repair exonuclease [Myxococcales bacterium]